MASPEGTDQVPAATADEHEELLTALADLVPAAFPDGQLDVGLLLDALHASDDSGASFSFTWPGIEVARADARAATTATLVPDPDASLNWETGRDVLIEGDNLQVLKLLKSGYSGAAKLIYIDPPFPRKSGCCGVVCGHVEPDPGDVEAGSLAA